MEVTETTTEGLKREFKIVVPAADIEAKMSSRLAEIAPTVRMPGFRPGKVPPKLVRKTYGKAILGEVLEQTVNESTEAAMTERGLRAATQPQVDLVGEVDAIEEGSDLEYTVAFERFPEIEVMDLTSVKLERLTVPADDARVDEALDQLAQSFKESKPVETKRKAKTGDITVIDFTGTIDGEEFSGGKAEGYSLELGSGAFIPGFEDQLVEASVGDKLEVAVTFPEGYAEELAGKDAKFAVEVKELREPSSAEINDDLAKRLGAENIDDLKGKLKENQESEYKNLARMRLKRDLLDILDKQHEFELPETMIDAEFEGIWNQFEYQREHNPDEIDEDDKGKSDDELKDGYRDIAVRRVRLGLLLSEIGRLNNIEVTSEELNRAIVSEAQRHQGQEKEVLEFYKTNPQAVQALQSPIMEEKVVDFVLEMADVSDREATMEELIASPDDEAEEKEKTAAEPKKKPKKTSASKSKAAAKKDDADG